MSGWSDIKEDLQVTSKQRLGLEGLEALLQQTTLSKAELSEVVNLAPGLLSSSNPKVAQQTLEALNAVVRRADTQLAPFASTLIPCVAERLGDSRQPVRAQALDVLVSLFKTVKPELVLDKLSPFWHHKSWKVKHGLLEVVAEVVSTTGASFLRGRDQNNAVLKQIVCMMDEPELAVREAAADCLDELYRAAPAAVVSTVQASNLRPAQQTELLTRLGVPSASTGAAPISDTGSKRASSGYTAVDVAASLEAGASQGLYTAGDFTSTARGRISGSGQAGTSAPAPASDAMLSRPVEARRPTSNSSAGPSQASAATGKRGGFKDGGGVTLDGELPAPAPIPIASERELREELEAAVATLSLAPNTEWQARMTAMQRVEGLVLGGAVEYECFHEALKGLAQVLTQQFKERRSTIARQTCHLIGVLARALGPRFEQHALTLLPTLFGVLVITVAVMAESADVGVRNILRHCHATRVLQTIADGVCKEKNPKTRQFCATYLNVILEDWDVGVWSRQLEGVEAAIKAAVQDPTGDTRQSGRTAMALYSSALPERAQAFLKRLDGGLQDKLSAAVSGGKPAKPAPTTHSRQALSAALAAKKMAARRAQEAADADAGIVVMVPTAVKSQQPAEVLSAATARNRSAGRTSSAAFLAPAPSSSQQGGSGDGSEGASRLMTGTVGRNSRKSLCLPPGRIPGGSADLTGLLGDSASTSAIVAAAPSASVRSSGQFQSDRGSGAAESGAAASSAPGLVPLSRVVSTILGGPRTWSDKVLAAALTLLGNLVKYYGRVLEGQLDRLLPLLLNKGAEGKEQSRALCTDIMHACGQVYRADALVPALSKCLDIVKLPRSKQMALEFFRAHVGTWSGINATQLKHWLVRLAPLLDDRTPDLRKRAGEVLDCLLAVPWAREPINYVAYQHNNADVVAVMAQLLDTAREVLSAAAAAADGSMPFAMGRHTAAMENLADAVERCSKEAWVRTFPPLMVELNSWVQHPFGAVRSMSYSLLRELLLHQPHLFTDNNLESQLGLLLHGCGDASREVSTPASQTLSVLLSSCNAQQAIVLMQELMPREREAHRRGQDKGARLVAVMEGVRQLAARLSPDQLHRLTFQPHPTTGNTLLEPLVANLMDVETCVRRGAVVTLAELWYRLGSSSDMMFVTITT
ncbi:CLASP protein [Gonium pectorale]|uniref:CLASP protein n=1 Tax=Gonium pectorale TaxID=33097 RepID=A0A150GNQ5_GONPE|nr:CLASP protein [Gonium pectorale]|eukprot:KXZ51447.1 CLASP protein [Gonium pectorale]